MASIHKKVGASGVESPFWQAKFKGLNGRAMWLTTKQMDYRKALAVAERWKKAVELASRWELTQIRTQKIVADIWELTKTPATVEITKGFLNDLLKHSISQELAGQNFEKFCDEWLDSKKDARATAESTLKRYRPVIQGFLAHLGEKRRQASVASISAIEIQRFRNSEIQAGKSPTTTNFAIRVLRGLFNTARDQEIIPTNPAKAVQLLPEESEDRVPFDENQVKALLARAGLEWKGMILFGYHCGIRLTDAANLTWENIDDDCRKLTFRARKTAKRKKQKSGKDSVVYLHSDLKQYLELLPTGDDPKAPLFPSLYGKESGSYGGLSNAFSRLMDEAGVKSPLGEAKTGKGRRFRELSYHSLRHSFISRLANAEVPADIRKQIVGHSSDDIHRRYTHLDLGLQQKAIEKLASVL